MGRYQLPIFLSSLNLEHSMAGVESMALDLCHEAKKKIKIRISNE